MSNIKTIITISESQFKEKGSLFLGMAFPVSNTEETSNILTDLWKKYYNSTHICYAYKIYPKSIKYSDDGEPSGTAGIRLLNAIKHFDLTNLFLVSIRYYGGTKLGVGLLGKTYYNSGIITLEQAKITEKKEYSSIELKFNYDYLSMVHYLIKKFNAIIYGDNSGEQIELKIKLLSEVTDDLIKEINEKSNNRIEISISKENRFLQ